jgi:hypothetical protein
MFANVTIPDLIVLMAAAIAGLGAWRSKRGDFYKSVADEKTAETERLRGENARLRDATDITPLKQTLEELTSAIQSVVDTNERVFAKIVEMNGSLRHHGEAMKALADRIILDEVARGLLRAAATQPPTPPT